jgi:quinoprotein glucose dehydrogenase/quinate dehydrogenase (quinone)
VNARTDLCFRVIGFVVFVVPGILLAIGGAVFDGQSIDEPPGLVRGFDARSGRLLWTWDLLQPLSRKKPLNPGETYPRNNPNAWSVFSADPVLGLVYVPTGNVPPDYYGAQRTAAGNRYSSSIVALDASTGDVRWSFQTVHHDLWDLDIPAQPVIVDFPLDDGTVKALIVPTKRGEIFVLDRLTGKPLIPVVERPVPQGGAPGELLSPTQPFVSGFPTFAPPHLREADMWGMSILDQMLCRITFRQRRYDGQFTPISLQGSIGFPDVFGVINWGSVAVDPERQLMLVNASWMPYLTRLISRSEADRLGLHPATGVPLGEKSAPHSIWLYPQAEQPSLAAGLLS